MSKEAQSSVSTEFDQNASVILSNHTLQRLGAGLGMAVSGIFAVNGIAEAEMSWLGCGGFVASAISFLYFHKRCKREKQAYDLIDDMLTDQTAQTRQQLRPA